MPTCRKCKEQFSVNWKNPKTGITHNLCNRKFCMECSPFGLHNTKRSLLEKSKSKFECPQCNQTKEAKDFYTRTDRPGNKAYSYCKACHNDNMKKRQKNVKQQCVDYKGGKCQICNYSTCVSALEFHHICELEDKQFAIAQYKNQSFNTVRSELDKCVLSCANCHREIHAKITKLPENVSKTFE